MFSSCLLNTVGDDAVVTLAARLFHARGAI